MQPSQRPRIITRTLLPGEPLPAIPSRDGLPLGFESLPLDPDWVWIVEHSGRPCGVLIASPAHSILLLLRIALIPDAPSSCLLLLLRRTMRDARARGLLGWMSMLTDVPAESRLLRIAMRSEARILPASGAWAFGAFGETRGIGER